MYRTQCMYDAYRMFGLEWGSTVCAVWWVASVASRSRPRPRRFVRR